LLSNAPHELADRISGHSAFGMFDHLLFSARLGLSKPDPEIYDAAVARLAVAAGEVLFVDDRAENIAAAAGVGLRTFHYLSVDALADRLVAWATTAVGEFREHIS
jgi:putative hydrolase of the HAD superfamily